MASKSISGAGAALGLGLPFFFTGLVKVEVLLEGSEEAGSETPAGDGSKEAGSETPAGDGSP